MTHPALGRTLFGTPLSRWFGCSLSLWAARLLAAWVVSRPIAVVLGAGDQEDRLLFEPGALWLLEVLRVRADLLGDALASSVLLLLGAAGALAAATTLLLALLIHGQAPPPAGWLTGGLRALPRTAALAGLVGLPSLALLLMTLLVTGAVSASIDEGARAAREAVVAGGAVLCLVVLAGGGVVFDLGRLHLLLGQRSLRATLTGAWATLRQRLVRLAALRIALAAASLVVVLISSQLVASQASHARETEPFLAVFVVHRAAGWLLAALQITWLAAIAGLAPTARRVEPEQVDVPRPGASAHEPSQP